MKISVYLTNIRTFKQILTKLFKLERNCIYACSHGHSCRNYRALKNQTILKRQWWIIHANIIEELQIWQLQSALISWLCSVPTAVWQLSWFSIGHPLKINLKSSPTRSKETICVLCRIQWICEVVITASLWDAPVIKWILHLTSDHWQDIYVSCSVADI